MAVYALGDLVPQIDAQAYVHPQATVIGAVQIGPKSTIWPQTVLRGDYARIVVGARTSIQDGAVIHCSPGIDTFIGDGCVIGHLAHLEGCIVEDEALVGVGAVILHRVVIRSHALVGANAVVPAGMEVPTGAMALGVPAKLRLDCVTPDMIVPLADNYVNNATWFPAELRRLD